MTCSAKFNHIAAMGSLLAGLCYYHEDFGFKVVDSVLEEIRLGMETNRANMNQRRVTTVKFLGELFNYTVVDSKIIFNALCVAI